MRVIAGRLGGRRIRAPRGRTTRPTAEAVREAVFSMLGDVSGADVLDLFAGSGALGIEALSRGAGRAVFVERSEGSYAALQANLRTLELGRGVALARRSEARAGMRTARRRGETYDLVFIDPPYRQAQDWAAVLRDALPALLKPAARVVIESDRRAPLDLELPLEQRRRYGDTLITIHRRA
jgi:16S rRNA (guanine(966)-N(2))-methyltransferase RsmD